MSVYGLFLLLLPAKIIVAAAGLKASSSLPSIEEFLFEEFCLLVSVKQVS
jgi:hypothetical protein